MTDGDTGVAVDIAGDRWWLPLWVVVSHGWVDRRERAQLESVPAATLPPGGSSKAGCCIDDPATEPPRPMYAWSPYPATALWWGRSSWFPCHWIALGMRSLGWMPGHTSIALLETLGYEKSNKKLLNLPGSCETKDPKKQHISTSRCVHSSMYGFHNMLYLIPWNEAASRPKREVRGPGAGLLLRSLWPARRLRQLRFPWSNSGNWWNLWGQQMFMHGTSRASDLLKQCH
jgi:hypothetical protein